MLENDVIGDDVIIFKEGISILEELQSLEKSMIPLCERCTIKLSTSGKLGSWSRVTVCHNIMVSETNLADVAAKLEDVRPKWFYPVASILLVPLIVYFSFFEVRK